MNVLETKEDLQVALAESYDSRVLIFKISNVCPTSEALYAELKKITSENTAIAKRINLLVVQDARELSNLIEMKFGIVHETPQVLIVENEDVIYYESHEYIDLKKVMELLSARG